MRGSIARLRGKQMLGVMVALLCAVVTVPVLSSAAGPPNVQPMMAIRVRNNASRDIYHIYLSPADRDAWGPDLMSEGTIVKPGESFTINEASCSGNEIKVIAEDKQGCFVYGVVGCAQASTEWVITDAMPPDCGN